MSYIFNNKIAYADTPNLDAFGRLRVASVTNLLDVKHVFDKIPLIVNETTGGTTPSSVFSQEYARVRMSASTNGDYVIRKSKVNPIYQPGKSQLFEASFSNFQCENNVIKRIGGFSTITASTYDSQYDGFFLESNGITSGITFNIYRTGTLVFSSDTSTWFNNEINPNTISWSGTNLMLVDYQWLGVGRMRLGMVLSGLTYYFTEHTSIGDEPNVYMSSPNQPIRYEIRSSGGTGYLDMICSQVSTEGALNGLYSLAGISYSATTTLNSDTDFPYIGIRLKPGYKSSIVDLSSGSLLNASAGKRNFESTVQFNPTITVTPTWIDIENSPIQYSLGTGGTQTISNRGYVLASYIGAADQQIPTSLNFQDNLVRIGTNLNGTTDEMWICIKPLEQNADFKGSLNVRYYV